jgi:hypothetical protein
MAGFFAAPDLRLSPEVEESPLVRGLEGGGGCFIRIVSAGRFFSAPLPMVCGGGVSEVGLRRTGGGSSQEAVGAGSALAELSAGKIGIKSPTVPVLLLPDEEARPGLTLLEVGARCRSSTTGKTSLQLGQESSSPRNSSFTRRQV